MTAAIFLWITLVCAALAGCQDDSRPPGWGEFDEDTSVDTDTNQPTESFVKPSGAVCQGRWCWLSPTPFGHTVTDLRPVDGDIYGAIGSTIGAASYAFIWRDDFQFVEIPEQILDDGRRLGLGVGDDGWLAVTKENVVYEFGVEGVSDTFQLPEDEYVGIEGHSIDTFMVSTPRDGGYIRREGELIRENRLEEQFGNARIWDDGDVWLVSDAAFLGTEPRWLERFPVPEMEDPPGPDAGYKVAALGANPQGPCADRGIWVSVLDDTRNLFRWEDSTEAWAESQSANTALLNDFACRGDGALVASSVTEGVFINPDDSWASLPSFGGARLATVAASGETLYAAGVNGAMFENGESGTRRIGEALLSGGLPKNLVRLSDIWVSPDESVAMIMHDTGIQRLTADGNSDVSSDVERIGSGLGSVVGGPKANEIWGPEEPEFAITRKHVLRWNGARWEQSSLSDELERQEARLVDIAGQAADDVIVATRNELYHYNGQMWRKATGDGNVPEQVIDDAGVDISSLMATSDAGYMVALGSELYRLERNNGAWDMTNVDRAPCDPVGAIHRSSESDDLWVAGPHACVARFDGTDWDVFEPTDLLKSQVPTEDPDTSDLNSPMPVEFADQSANALPLVGNSYGIFKPTSEGKIALESRIPISDIDYLPGTSATVALTTTGVLASYDAQDFD